VKSHRLVAAATLTALSVAMPALAAGRRHEKVDNALASAMKSGSKTQNVIITTEPGSRSGVRKSLEGKGRRIKAEHASLNLLVSELSTDEVLALLKDKNVKALSLDGPVHPDRESDTVQGQSWGDSWSSSSLTSSLPA
jgi:hypothetical protein